MRDQWHTMCERNMRTKFMKVVRRKEAYLCEVMWLQIGLHLAVGFAGPWQPLACCVGRRAPMSACQSCSHAQTVFLS